MGQEGPSETKVESVEPTKKVEERGWGIRIRTGQDEERETVTLRILGGPMMTAMVTRRILMIVKEIQA